MGNILNEINLMKYLTQYKRGVVISEQSTVLKEGTVVSNCVREFQSWVKDVKQDPDILGTYGADGKWGPKTKSAFDKYGVSYGDEVLSKTGVSGFQNYVKNVKKDSC